MPPSVAAARGVARRPAPAARRPAHAAAAATPAPSSPAHPARPRQTDARDPPPPSPAPSRSPTQDPSARPPRTPAAAHETPDTPRSDSARRAAPRSQHPSAPHADTSPTPSAALRSPGSAHPPAPDPRPPPASPRPDPPRRLRSATAQAKRPLPICQEAGGLFPFWRTSSRARTPPELGIPAESGTPTGTSRARTPARKLFKTLRVSNSNSNYDYILNPNDAQQALHPQTKWRSTAACQQRSNVAALRPCGRRPGYSTVTVLARFRG